MQIICISRGSQSRGEQFAEKLAAKLGYDCLSREQLLEEASRRKIPIGKLETAIIKPHLFSEDLAVEMEHYKALATSIVCRRALDGGVVYHGRTGHLLLPGIENILKIRVVADMEYRIRHVMHSLDLSRTKARRYIEHVEEDRRRWVKRFYNVDWDVFGLYDIVLNLSHVAVDNAASAACSMAELPDFQATPASRAAVRSLYLTATARLMLAADERTSRMNARVQVGNGNLYIVYPYQQAGMAAHIPQVLKDLPGIKDIVCTEAQTHILWVQESFERAEDAFKQVVSLAEIWDAAVEIAKLVPTDDPKSAVPVEAPPVGANETWRETGIIDDDTGAAEEEAEDASAVYERLINAGRAGGKRIIRGNQKTLLGAIDRSAGYRLIVFDNVFLDKGQAVRVRQQREWSNALAESLRVPVVTLNEIGARYHFGGWQAVRMAVFATLAALMVAAVFTFDNTILAFLSREGTHWRILAAVAVFVFVPVFAYVYSTVTSLLLKMIKLD